MSNDPLFPAPAEVPFRKSLSAQLGRQMIILIVGALILLGGGLIWIARESEMENARRLQQQSAAKVAMLISDYVNRALDLLRFFETTTELCEKPIDDQRRYLETLLMARTPIYSQLVLVGPDAVESVKVSRFHTYLPTEIGKKAEQDLMVTAKGADPFIGPVYFSQESGLLSVKVAVACGRTPEIGVLAAEVNISRLWQEVSQIRIGASGYAYLVDKGGRFVAYQEISKVLQRYAEDMRRMPPVAEYVSESGAPQTAQQYMGLNNENVIGHHEPIPGTTWAVIVETPVREAYSAAYKMQWFLLGMTLLGVAASSIAAFWASTRLVRPILALTQAARLIGSGDLGAAVEVPPTGNEVDVLTGAFRRMQEELKTLYHNMERQLAELRRTEEELRQSRRQVKDIADNIPGLIFQFVARSDGYMGLSYLGERSREFTGIHDNLDDFYERFTAQVFPDDRDAFVKSVLKAVSTASPWMFEGRFVRPSGELMWFQGISVPQRRGDDLLFNGVLLDITERKRTEVALRESESGFKTLVNSSPDGIILYDLDGLLIDANQSFLRMTGYDFAEIRGKHFGEFVPGEGKLRLYESIEGIKEGFLGEIPLEIEFVRKNGAHMSVLMKGWLMRGEDGTPHAFGAFVTDITEEKRLANEKKALEEQVLRNQKMEAIGTMAGGIAHDFNNILTGIMGYTELAIMSLGNDHPDILRNLSSSLAAGNRAKELVQQLLRFSRKETGEMGPTSLKSILREVLKLIRSTLPSTIRIEDHISAGQNMVMGAATQLHQVIMNLCINAFHAMKTKGGTLTVSLKNEILSQPKQFHGMECQPGPHAVLTVADTGIGIAPDHLERIFEPYFTTKQQGEGTGLGLSVSFGVIKSHNGVIEVKSTPGVGTVFTVYLPLIPDAPILPKGPEMPIVMGKLERILVVDDEMFFRDVVCEMLRRLNYSPTVFDGSLSALNAFSAAPDQFDVIITDQTMPDMTGIELISRIRAVKSDLPIILCTGYSDDVTDEASKHYGITRILHKPINREELSLALSEALTDHKKSG